MGKRRTILIGGLAVLAVVAATVAVRTASFTAANIADGSDVRLAATPRYDLAAAIAHLSAAAQIRTISHQDPADNDVAEWDRLHAWLAATYPATHRAMARTILPNRTLIYHWPGSDAALAPIIVMAHQDVVPVTEGTEGDWKYPPFAGTIAEQAVWGRGTVDDKGSLVALFEAIEALAGQGFQPKRGVYLVSGHDEEVGGSGAVAAAAKLKSEGVKAIFTLDEGSVVLTDTPVINSPAIMIGIAEKGYATLKVTAEAPGGHSSMPPAETGVGTLARAITAITEKPFPLSIRGPGAAMLEALAAEKGGTTKMAVANQWLFGPILKRQVAATPSTAAAFHTTIAPTMLEGSPKENVLPQTANALINYRIAPWNRSADIMARAKDAVGDLPVELAWVKPPREPSRVSSTSSQGWKWIAATARADAPGAVLSPILVVGGTDSRSMEPVSEDVYRFMPMHFSLKETAMIHGTNEHMKIDSFKRMIDFYARLIATSAG
ncbi:MULTISPECIES: M20 family peptidase [unclassified Sphingopyxis]|uniref:M20 family peptidase n=1 Tax=unclassified Sphingopyxis TaxID=2614943 RepID=UPI00286617B0|nr:MULTISPECIES: M20 family peptidase [unclassified Sphingopyxis]MDR6835129.1 carboxypeptidase PM20D1 [Sphingopyxis sp. BE122]MDR7227416.1 carboxypeptidase PM20D1 [Sphingopyxis sp. BE259]